MKKCPYCSEEIQDDAIKCRYCKEWLDKIEPSISEPDKIETVKAEVVETPTKLVGKPPTEKKLESKADYNINARLVFPQGFKDPTGLTKWLHILLFLSVGISAVAFCSSWLQLDLLSDIKNGIYPSIPELESNKTREGIIGFIWLIVSVITNIVFCIWIYRANYNARKLGVEGMKFSPAWSVGWFFIPIANLWKPFQAMNEIWKASNYSWSDWKNQSTDPIVGWWWAVWVIAWVISFFFGYKVTGIKTIQDWYSFNIIQLIGYMVHIPLSILAIFLVGNIFEMQMYKKTTLEKEVKVCPNCGTKNQKGDFICAGCRIALGL